jgi:allophanate hydrolase subunit 2
VIEIERVVGVALIEDGGRPGRMHEGTPTGGALIPEALARANRAVASPPDAAGIERYGALSLIARAPVRLADDAGRTWSLDPGERCELGWDGARRARYLAAAGGIDVPEVLGGRGTHLAARLGGLEGRPLRRGDVLRVGALRGDGGARERRSVEPERNDAPIAIVVGPDLAQAPDALAVLTAGQLRISTRSDRTGTRLEGVAISPIASAAGHARTTPMVAGAIELPASGEPIVLGPDHPTTGGYPVIAVIARAELGRFHALPIGAAARFVVIEREAALALWVERA